MCLCLHTDLWFVKNNAYIPSPKGENLHTCLCFCKLLIFDSLSLPCQVMPVLPLPALAVLVMTAVNDLHTVGLYVQSWTVVQPCWLSSVVLIDPRWDLVLQSRQMLSAFSSYTNKLARSDCWWFESEFYISAKQFLSATVVWATSPDTLTAIAASW